MHCRGKCHLVIYTMRVHQVGIASRYMQKVGFQLICFQTATLSSLIDINTFGEKKLFFLKLFMNLLFVNFEVL
jgi:hypothetical protein